MWFIDTLLTILKFGFVLFVLWFAIVFMIELPKEYRKQKMEYELRKARK